MNRIVPSSVPSDRPFWQEREKQRKGRQESPVESPALDEPVARQKVDGGEAASTDGKTGKGKHVDVNA